MPGYKLVERLGRGGFGEVWKAEVPGGLQKAIKFVYGDLDASGGSEFAEQELKSLSRIKSIRHPYILSLERFDIIDGQLLIVMELADRNLWDRFRECRSQNLTGIPRAELLSYLEEAAEALDLMNGQHNLQHLDIKPQNLFLVYNHVKIADFGLVKDFEGKRGTITGGVTPVYAAPETFDGWVSRNSDQYSLAIVYQELLTGERPFNGTMARQLVLQHMQAPPDVAMLPESDRRIITKALAKKPDDRFPTCAAMVQALIRAKEPSAVTVAPTVVVQTTTPDNTPSALVSGFLTSPATPMAKRNHRGAATGIRPRTEIQPSPDDSVAVRDLVSGPEALTPCVILGLGGAGNQVLRLFRRAVSERFGQTALPHIRMVALDTDPAALRNMLHSADQSLEGDELFHAGLGRPSRYLRSDLVAELDSWLGNSTLYRLPKNPGAAELRAFGRLALMDHAAALGRRLRDELEQCSKSEAIAESERITGLKASPSQPRVYVVANLSGGTGGGMFIDAAYLAKSVMKRINGMKPDVVGLLLLPPSERFVGNAALANSFAALTELHHFSLPTTNYSAKFEPKQPAYHDAGPPFQSVMLLPLADPGNAQASQAALGQASGWLLRELLTPIGRAVMTTESSIRTASTYHFAWPRERAARLAARHVGRDLIHRWLTKDATSCRDVVQTWVEEQWEEKGLSPEKVAERLHDLVSCELGAPPVEQVEKLIAPMDKMDPAEVTAEMLHTAFDEACALLGSPEARDKTIGTVFRLFERARPEISQVCDRLITELASRAVERPGMRIVGAEEAARLIGDKAKQAITSYEALAESLNKEVAETTKKLVLSIIELDRQQSAKKCIPIVKSALQLFHVIPKKKYQAMLAQTLRDIYRGTLGTIPDYLQEMNLCRERPAEAIRELDRRMASELDLDVALGPGRSLLPGGDSSPTEFASRCAAELTEEEMLEIDAAAHVQIVERFDSLINFCIGNGPKPEHMADALESTITEFFLKRLTNDHPAELLTAYDLTNVVSTAIREGRPPLAPPECGDSKLTTVISAPASDAGAAVINAANDALAGNAVSCDSDTEVVIYRELSNLQLASLPHFGPIAREAYQKATADGSVTPHSRLDITWEPVN